MMAPQRLVRRCWLGMVAVPVIVIILLAMNSLHPNSGRSTAPPVRTIPGPEAAFAADNKSVPPTSPEELATGLGIDSEAGLTLAPPRMSRAVSPDRWLGSPASKPVPEALWGKHTIGKVTDWYPNRWTQVRHFFDRLRAQYAGIRLPVGAPVTLDTAITLYVIAQVPRPGAFIVYYSPGLDGATTWITPIARTNSGQVRSIRAPLHVLLASNGFSVARLKPDVIKVFPTSMACAYSNAPINETNYPK